MPLPIMGTRETQASKPQTRRGNVSGAIRIPYSETWNGICRMGQLVIFLFLPFVHIPNIWTLHY